MKKNLNLFVMVIAFFSYGFIPVPLFLDLAYFEFILTNEPFPIAQAPLPVGMIFFSCGLVLFHILNFFSGNFTFFIKSKMLRYMLLIFSFFLFLWLYFLAELSFLKIIQVMMPLLGAIFFIFPKDIRVLNLILNMTIFMAALFFFFHFFSLFINNVIFLEITEYEFPYFFDITIYQSLVSYPGVIFIYFCIFFYLSIKCSFIYRFLYTALCVVPLSLLGFAARRASVFELLILFLTLIVISSIYMVRYLKVNKKVIMYIFTFFPFFILVFYFLSKFPLGERFSRTYQSGEFDSGRMDIYEKAFNDFSSNLVGLLLGQPGKSGYHNYFLDVLYNIGVFPILFLLNIVFIYLIYDYKKIFISLKMIKCFKIEIILLIGCFSSFFVQSMVNASITQPYYLMNLLVICLYFVVKNRGV